MSILTFKGGVHPYDGKELSKDIPTRQIYPDGEVVIPVAQHIGAPAKPIVNVGDRVLVGQKIAEANGFVSANIHSSVSGTVKKIEQRLVPNGSKVLSAVNTGNLVLSDDYFDKQVYSKDIGKYLNVNQNDFAYNPARINIGSIGLNTFDFNCCVSPVYVTFSVDKDYIDFFDFYFKSKKFNAEVTLRASGSVRQALNYNDFGLIEIPYPTKEMINKFNSSYKTIKDRINKNKAKIIDLEQIRDTLLPKLMNGEIDLDKIEI